MQMNDDLRAMARHRYGYGRWNAPYWFLGLEEGMDRGESDDRSERTAAWRCLGKRVNAELQYRLMGVIESLLLEARALPAVSLNQLTVGPGATVQLSGNDSSILHNEYLNATERTELIDHVRELRIALTTRAGLLHEDVVKQAVTLVAVAEDEAAKAKPSKKVVVEVLKTLRNIGEGAVGSLLASSVQDKLFALFKTCLG